MKSPVKKHLTRSLMLLLLSATSMATLSVKSSAALLKVGDEFGGGKIVYIFNPGDKGYAERTEQAVIIGKADVSVNIYWSEAKTSMDRIDAIGYHDVNLHRNTLHHDLAIGSAP